MAELVLGSYRTLIGDRFIPALIYITGEKIAKVHPCTREHVATFKHEGFINLGDKYLGPGLVDVAPEFCKDSCEGGVTTVIVSQDVGRKYRAQAKPMSRCLEFAHGGVEAGASGGVSCSLVSTLPIDPSEYQAAIMLQADFTNCLASPLHGKPFEDRKASEGIQWRLGRTRRASDEGHVKEDNSDALDGVKVPSGMLKVLLDKEASTYSGQDMELRSGLSLGKSHRPPALDTSVRAVNVLSPSYFKRDYQVHLSLRAVETELNGVTMAGKFGSLGVLRLASACSLNTCLTLDMWAGTTVTHLMLCDEDVKFGNTTLKMDPPLRHREDRDALLNVAIGEDSRFILSSGHCDRDLNVEPLDFERAQSNGPTQQNFLAAVWEVSKLVGGDVDTHFARLWCKASRSPCELFDLTDRGSVKEGMFADLVCFDPAAQGRTIRTILAGFCHGGAVTDVFLGGRRIL